MEATEQDSRSARTAALMDRFNAVFLKHDPTALGEHNRRGLRHRKDQSHGRWRPLCWTRGVRGPLERDCDGARYSI